MGDHPDDVPSLEELESGAAMPEYWMEPTTITVDRHVKESLDRHRNGQPWNQYLEKLRREHADPLTFNDAEQIAEFVSEELRDDLTLEIDRAELATKVADEVEGRMR